MFLSEHTMTGISLWKVSSLRIRHLPEVFIMGAVACFVHQDRSCKHSRANITVSWYQDTLYSTLPSHGYFKHAPTLPFTPHVSYVLCRRYVRIIHLSSSTIQCLEVVSSFAKSMVLSFSDHVNQRSSISTFDRARKRNDYQGNLEAALALIQSCQCIVSDEQVI